VVFGIQGANDIADQPSLIQLYCDLGVRWMLMAYNRNNRVGGGCRDDDSGLTAFGREVLGYGNADIGAIPGGNLMHVARDVWAPDRAV